MESELEQERIASKLDALPVWARVITEPRIRAAWLECDTEIRRALDAARLESDDELRARLLARGGPPTCGDIGSAPEAGPEPAE